MFGRIGTWVLPEWGGCWDLAEGPCPGFLVEEILGLMASLSAPCHLHRSVCHMMPSLII